MDLRTQQKIFDDVKWFDSIQAGTDCCGSYTFCDRCRKTDEYPCARAANRKENGYIRVATVYGAIRKYIYLGGIK